jgi:hypothetical protein
MRVLLKKPFLVLFFTVILSCDSDEKKEYYDGGELKKRYTKVGEKIEGLYLEYYRNGNIKSRHKYLNNRKIDSSVYYYYESINDKIDFIRYWSNDSTIKEKKFDTLGNIISSGRLDSELIKVGKWNFFSKGKIVATKEYINIKGEEYLNQSWHLNERGDTISTGTHFEILFSKDTIDVDQPLRAVTFLDNPLFEGDKSEIFVCIPADSVNLNKDFSNLSEIKLDTFYNLSKDKINQKWLKGENINLTAVFGKWFKTSGKKQIRGVIVERVRDSIIKEHIKYFDKQIFVK